MSKEYQISFSEEEKKLASKFGINKLFAKYSLDDDSYNLLQAQFAKIFLLNIKNDTTLYPDILEVLAKLQELYTLVIYTAKIKKFTLETLELFDLNKYFEAVYFSESFEEKKPSSKPIVNILKNHNFTKQDSLIIGDTSSDLNGAKNADVKSCFASYGYGEELEMKKIGFDYIIKKPVDLIDLLKK